MSADDLVVQGSVLEQTATSMQELRAEFDALDRKRGTPAEAWGHEDVASAVREFADDWNDRRRKLSSSMRSVEQMATDCVCEFTRVDDELGRAVS